MPLPFAKPPCPECGAVTRCFWTYLVGAAFIFFFPLGTLLALVKPVYRCWACGCHFRGQRNNAGTELT